VVIARGTFLQGLAGAATVATGGLDVWETGSPQIRVLIGALGAGSPDVYPDGTFGFGGKRWRGAPSTVRLDDGRMALVTTIDVDRYLQGVLPLETPPSWPAAALEAQAIVARTFALARRTLSRPYDLTASDADQRWGGVEAEAPSCSAAIAATRGLTLAFGGGAAAVFYSACCGGHTADIAGIWGGTPLPYLRGVGDPYCSAAPDYRWSRDVPLPRAVSAFGARTGGTLVAAEVRDPDDSGRPRTVELVGASSASVSIPDFRRGLGSEVVRSTWVRGVRVEAQAGARLVIEGSGRGHGVGLCQWGARFFASSGASARAILAFYFPGTSVIGG
jgi:stage II sporulation protein D